VPKDHELRVTIVGEQVFGCRIDSQARPETAVDWRAGGGRLAPQHAVEVEQGLARRCIALSRRLALDFAGLDLIVTPRGEVVFLEINANAQWLWLDRDVGLPIARAIAERLVAGAAAHRESSAAALTT
jgi:glutathione synthase/RimK-type ligase-like ATP-grasp enzyme